MTFSGGSATRSYRRLSGHPAPRPKSSRAARLMARISPSGDTSSIASGRSSAGTEKGRLLIPAILA